MKNHNKLQKGILLLLVLTMMLAVFSGCRTEPLKDGEGTNSTSQNKPDSGSKEKRNLSISIAQSRYFPGLKQIFEKLEKEENIRCDVRVIPDEQYDNLMKMQLNSGEAADLIDYNIPQIGGVVPNPDDYFYELSKEAWAERMVMKGNSLWKGKLYGYPFRSNNGALAIIYNKDVFKKAGVTKVPETKKEFDEACEKIKAIGVTPLLMPSDIWVPQIWLDAGAVQAYGSRKACEEFFGKVFKNEAKLTDSHEMIEVLDDWLALVKAGYFNDDFKSVAHTECLQRLINGEGAMYYQNAINMINILVKDHPNANLGIMTYPGDFNKNHITALAPHSPGFAVNKNSKNMETALEALNIMSQPEYGNLYFTAGNAGSFPALEGIDGGKRYPACGDYYENDVLKKGNVPELNAFIIPVQSLTGSTLWVYLQEAADGRLTSVEVLERFQRDIEKYMKQQHAPGF